MEAETPKNVFATIMTRIIKPFLTREIKKAGINRICDSESFTTVDKSTANN